MAKNKDELSAEALGLGIDLSDGPSKAVIQERIDAKMEEMAANVMSGDALLGVAPASGFTGGRGDQTRG